MHQVVSIEADFGWQPNYRGRFLSAVERKGKAKAKVLNILLILFTVSCTPRIEYAYVVVTPKATTQRSTSVDLDSDFEADDYERGFDAGYRLGEGEGEGSGYSRGYRAGSDEGYEKGYEDGFYEGEQSGYDWGYYDALDEYGINY